MQININTDNQVHVTEEARQKWQSEIASALQRFRDWITRVEVHLTDENSSSKGGSDDIRCLMEARPAGKQPVSIEVRVSSPDHAITEGAKTLQRRLGTLQDKSRAEGRKGSRGDIDESAANDEAL